MGKLRFFELFSCALFAGLAALVIWDVRDLPPPLFGPIGSADLPRAIGWLVVGLSGLVAIIAVTDARHSSKEKAPPQWRPMVVVLAITALYAGLLDWGRIDFGLLSTVYLWTAIGYLARPRGVGLVALAIVGAGLGFGCDALFTRVLFIDLP